MNKYATISLLIGSVMVQAMEEEKKSVIDNGFELVRAVAHNRDMQTVMYLLDCKADVNSTDRGFKSTALMYAASRGRFDVVKLLLARGADSTVRDSFGDTALDKAVHNDHICVIVALLEHNKDGRDKALMDAVRYNHLGTIRILLSYGANPNRQTPEGSLVRLALNRKNYEGVKALLLAGARADDFCEHEIEEMVAHEKDKDTALLLAVMCDNEDTVDDLLSGGADPDVHVPGGSLLHKAVAQRNHDMVWLLLRAGANTDVTDEAGKTAYTKAIASRDKKMVMIFLRHFCKEH